MSEWARVEQVFAGLAWPKALGNCTGGARYFSTCDYFDLCHGRPLHGVPAWAAEEPPFGFRRADDGEIEEQDDEP